MKEFLAELRSKKVLVYLENNDLKVKFSGSALPLDILSGLKENKAAIVQFLIQQEMSNSFSEIKPVELTDHYPLSSSQKRLWVLSQFEDGNVAYNMTEAMYFDGSLNLEALRFALLSVFNRHESLRTVFRKVGDEIRQFIMSPGECKLSIPLEDLRSLENPEELLKASIRKNVNTPIDLSKGPLIRAKLYQLKDDQFVLFYSLHHIISDGWSIGVLSRELIYYYGCYCNGSELQLPALKIHYKDYAVWQQEQLKRGFFNVHRDYWTGQFSSPQPLLDLPSDRNRPAMKTYNGSEIYRRIDKKLVNEFRILCTTSGATLFMGLVSLVKLLFFRYTGVDDITIGSPIAGRDHIDLEEQIGFYVNTLALRTKFSGRLSFRELMEQVKMVTLNAYQHQAFPFDELVSSLAQHRDISRNPLFDVMVVLLNASLDVENSGGLSQGESLSTSSYDGLKKTSSLFDLRFSFREREYGLDAMVEFNSDIFDESRIEMLYQHLSCLIEAVLQNPEYPIEKLDYLGVGERNLVMHEFNNTAHPFKADKSLVDLFSEQVLLSPDRVAVEYRNERFTFEQLDLKSNRLANLLQGQLLKDGDAGVAIMLSRGVEQVIAMLGILKAGAAYLPIDLEYPEERILYMLENAQVQTLVVEKSVIEKGNRLLWRSASVRHLICVDTSDFYAEMGQGENTLMSKEMWDSVGSTAADDIMAGGWMSSYTGQYFSEQEMREFSENVFLKLEPFLSREMRVLEIGCSSGMTLFQIAPRVGFYYATDISSVILERTKQEAALRGLSNIRFQCLPAHEIGNLTETDFDLIIINSVIHCFNGYNYLRNVLSNAIAKLKKTGLVFLGDLMDLDLKADLVKDMVDFKQANRDLGFRTKTDWSRELFVSRDYLNNLITEAMGIDSISYSGKIGLAVNELTKFRYDAILTIRNKAAAPAKNASSVIKKVYCRLEIDAAAENRPAKNISPHQLAYIIYTSGSTGNPKGCMLSHKGIVNRLEWMWDNYNFTTSDVILQKTTFTFDVSVWEFFLPLCWGAKMVICEKEDAMSPERIYDLVKTRHITCLHFVPSMFNLFVAALFTSDASVQLFSLNKVFCSGEALASETVKKWYSRFSAPVYNLYGPTEASIDVTYFNTGSADAKIPIGKPIWNTRIYILDENGQIVPVGIYGEICIAGIGLAKGYIGQPELTSSRFIDSELDQEGKLYRTGDLGRWMSDGNIEYGGRKDEQIKIRGYRVEPAEIEYIIRKHPDIEEAVVIAKQNQEGDKELVAYITGKAAVNYANLRSFLSVYLPAYLIPVHCVQLESMPLLVNGKLDKKSFPDPKTAGYSSGLEYVPPQTALEIKLAGIFEEVLNKSPIGITEDFFEIGGDSFKAIRIVAKFGTRISLLDIYKNPRIKDLAVYLESGNSDWILKLLTNGSPSCKSSIIVLPFGGGDPIAYQEVAKELSKLTNEVDLYCLAAPRSVIDTARKDFTEELDILATKIVGEIKARISTPVIVYTKCVSGGLGLEITRRLEEEGIELKALCVGGAMALTENPWVGPVFSSNDERIALLRRLGATVPEDHEEQAAFCNNVNFDIGVNLSAYVHMMKNIDNGNFNRLKTPLYCIVGTSDPTTVGYQDRYNSWYYYAAKVSLEVIQNVGHYFSRDKPAELAAILYGISEAGIAQDQTQHQSDLYVHRYDHV